MYSSKNNFRPCKMLKHIQQLQSYGITHYNSSSFFKVGHELKNNIIL